MADEVLDRESEVFMAKLTEQAERYEGRWSVHSYNRAVSVLRIEIQQEVLSRSNAILNSTTLWISLRPSHINEILDIVFRLSYLFCKHERV